MIELLQRFFSVVRDSGAMRAVVLVILLHFAFAVIQDRPPGESMETNLNHTLTYLYTATAGFGASTKVVGAGLIDGTQFYRFDNDSWGAETKAVWIKKLVPNPFWENQTKSQTDSLRDVIDLVNQNSNASEGSSAVQLMVGCEKDGRTGKVNPFHKYGYKEEDFILYDPERAWIVRKWPDALQVQRKWNHNSAAKAQIHQFLTKICPDWLQNNSLYLDRIENPSVFLLQKIPSSNITCLATGFYPNRAVLFWRKDGKELHQGVRIGDSLPNHDGTFQMRARLEPPPEHEDWQRFQCVFQFSGVNMDIHTKLDKKAIKSNSGSDQTWTNTIISISVFLMVALVVCLILVSVWRESLREWLRRAWELLHPAEYNSVSTSGAASPSGRNKDCEDLEMDRL